MILARTSAPFMDGHRRRLVESVSSCWISVFLDGIVFYCFTADNHVWQGQFGLPGSKKSGRLLQLREQLFPLQFDMISPRRFAWYRDRLFKRGILKRDSARLFGSLGDRLPLTRSTFEVLP